jgi:hypothetical protein
VALLLGCHGHNQTFTHQSFSLESAVLDAQMLLAENPDQTILVGGVDEITEASHALMQRAGIFGRGVPHGEGGFFFVCTSEKQTGSYAQIVDQRTLFKPESIEKELQHFLKANEVDSAEIDLVLFGGMDQPWDEEANKAVKLLFPSDKIIAYKKYCGEFTTSMGFAVWLGASLLKGKQVLPLGGSDTPKKNLIYNPYLGHHHSLILLESCHGTN